jgi:hypothetical protein
VAGYCDGGVGSHITSAECTGGGGHWIANSENYTAGSSSYQIAKGYMGALSTPGVRWRLPTKYDYQQADIDGIRFVMPDLGAAGNTGNRANDGSPGSLNSYYEWTATIGSNSNLRQYVLSFSGTVGGTNNGGPETGVRNYEITARCVGRWKYEKNDSRKNSFCKPPF